VDYTKESECLGGAGNVAANLAALGASVQAFGVAGDDEAGLALRRCLRKFADGNGESRSRELDAASEDRRAPDELK
jgi:bifunctional ADP-heptose synthase (sugar kinase/adenylyltransferase)